MFMGEYNHTVDAKGRLIIPAKFRDSLGEEFVVSKGLDGCLFVLANNEWQKFVDKLLALPTGNKDARQLTRYFLAGAENVSVDKQGRILISEVLRKAAAIDKDVVVTGYGNRIEIWSRDRWEGVMEDVDAEEIAEKMALLGMGI
ncbi:MAG: division/cell wall cluster transcriptional repressor MraZ [Lachnospiraceae bacterium]|nr:division/cell wall cluster transcriptional repressor MraZ [Lachnospiraceae bacterium]